MAICILTQPDQFEFDSFGGQEIFELMDCHFGSLEKDKILQLKGNMVANFLNQQYLSQPEYLEGGAIFEPEFRMDTSTTDNRVSFQVKSSEEGEIREETDIDSQPMDESLEEGEIREETDIDSQPMDESLEEGEIREETDIKCQPMDESLEEGEIREERVVNGKPINKGDKYGHVEPLEEGELPQERDITGKLINERDKYRKIRRIGQGGEATCYLSKRRSDQALVVCKVYPKSRGKEDEIIPTEVQILESYLPPNDRIVRYHELVETEGLANVYLDYYSGGDLDNFIYNFKDHGTKVPESFIWHAILQLAEALAYIHFGYDRHSKRSTQPDWQTVIHRDIKPSNILLRLPAYNPSYQTLTEPPYPSLVLADFGLATLDPSSNYIGTYVWQPPEVPEASSAADCWALGACIHAMAVEGRPPIKGLPKSLPKTRRNKKLWQVDPAARAPKNISAAYSQELQDCMAGALIFEPSLRHNAGQILGTAVSYSERPPWTKAPREVLPPWVFEDQWA